MVLSRTYSFLTVENGVTYQKPQVKAYYNYINPENYFLKASGKTQSKSQSGTCIGCTFIMRKTELNGKKHPEMRSLD